MVFRSLRRMIVCLTMCAVVFGQVTVGIADDKFGGLFRALKRATRNTHEAVHERVKPEDCKQPSVEELAGQIDWLEHHLEIYGSVIPKQPDIWGEARLTRHRQEVEEQLAAELSTFSDTLQGALSRSDESSLGFMMALGTIVGDAAVPQTSINASAQTTASNPVASATARPTLPTSSTFESKFTTDKIQLEPVIQNDQLYRYLNALNTLRRLNEGDDTADAPGYALNLVRLPASVLPGRRTRQGYGAEISYTIRPYLSDDLLPKTFRSLAINDQIDQLSLHIKRLLEDYDPTDRVKPLEPLIRYVQAERSAAPLINLFYQRLNLLERQANLNGTPDALRYFNFLNGRREYLRNRIIELEAAWRFAETFSTDEARSDVVVYDLGRRDLGLGDDQSYLEFEVSVQVRDVRNALFRLLQTGIAITQANLKLSFGETNELEIPLEFVLTERNLVGYQVVDEDLPYDVWLPIVPLTDSSNKWFREQLEIRKQLGEGTAIWNSLKDEIYAEVNAAVNRNVATLAKAGAGLILGTEKAGPASLAFVDLEGIAAKASDTTFILPIDDGGLIHLISEMQFLVASARLLQVTKGALQTLETSNLGEQDRQILDSRLAKVRKLIAISSNCENWATPELSNQTATTIRTELARLNEQMDAATKNPQPPTQVEQASIQAYAQVYLKNVLKAAAEASGALPSDELKMRLKEFATTLRPHVEAVAKMNVKGFSSTSLQLVPLIASLDNQQLERLQAWLPCLKPLAQQVEFISLAEPGLTSTYAPSNRQAGNKPANSSLVQEIQPLAMMPNYIPEQLDRASNAIEIRREIPRAYSGQFSVHAQNVVGDKVGSGIVFSTPARTRGASHPLSPSQVMDVYGHSTILEIALLVRSVLGASPPNAGNDKLMEDVRRVLADELGAAYDFLSQPDMHHIWQFGCADLANAIRIRDYETVRRLRDDFFTRLPGGVAKSPTGALGWALMVESSLLSVRLADDMTELAASKGCMCGDVTGYCFWGPTPPPESCQAFSEYVQCKWPIQVFTVDPASQDQNIADSYSVTRELQIAAAVAAATGEVSLSTAAEFARKVQVNIDTVALNRTAVGFTHGNDTFGWRYYPRLQSAGTTGLVGTIGQTIMGGPSRDSLLRQRMMEPGIRESVAVVVMPSFVPFVTIESRTSWFHLNDPADRELTLKDSMQLSRAQHAVESFLTCARDCGCYRPGDISQMATVLDQLSSRLPLQRSILQVPYENASGGFEVFRSGMAGLAPELTGWYGAPGIDPTGSTSLFLVGRGFSVHQTRVIVGGRSVSYRLLARDRMEITVPPGVQVLGGPEGRDSRVDVHVATPYGVSSHLLIPKVTPNNRVTTPVSWNPGTMRLTASLAVADNPAATTVQNLVMSPAQPVGAFVPIASLGAEADVKLQLFLQTSAGATPSGSEITVGKGRYNALTSVYEVDPLQLGTLLDTVKAQVQTYVRTGVIPTSAPSVTFLGRGSLNFGSIVHPIEGLLSITVDLTK